MIIISSLKNLQTSLRDNMNVLVENTEKYKIFSVPIEKEMTKIDKEGNESVATISYKLKFIDSTRFMATSLSNLVDNLKEGINKAKCKY